MSVLRSVVCATLLVIALPAQSYKGEPPYLVSPPTVEQDLTFAKLGYYMYENIDLAPGASPTDTYVVVSGVLALGSPFVLNSYRWDETTGTVTRLTDYDGIKQDWDRNPTVSRDRLLTTFTRGTSIMLARRAASTDPWGTPVPISGLPADCYSPALTQLGAGGPSPLTPALIVCKGAPTSTIELFRLDPALASALHVITLQFQMQRPLDYWLLAAPVEDPNTGQLAALFPVYQQGFPNSGSVLHYVAGVDGKSPALDVLGATGNGFTGGTMRQGGRFLAVARGGGAGAPPWTNNPVNLDMVFAIAAKVKASGGPLELLVFSPPTGVSQNSILGVGVLAQDSIALPGVMQGNLGLQPNPPPVFLAQPTAANSVTRWSFFLQPTVPAELWMQAFWIHVAFYAGSNARLGIEK